jgi:L-ribulose-5-phosphate 4-epimerase
MIEQLKQKVLKANLLLNKYGLVTLTWGNVSGISRSEGLVAIKPSGIPYDTLTISDIVIINMEGRIVEGNLRPSSDAPTHLELYKAFPEIEGITHSHSMYATIFAQACKEIECFGTTHADHFNGTIPVTRFLTEEEVSRDYEGNTGKVIIEKFSGINPMSMPGVLVAGHAPFTWGKSPEESVNNNLILERIAEMTLKTIQLNPKLNELPQHILLKHYYRKHGPDAYYGQKIKGE